MASSICETFRLARFGRHHFEAADLVTPRRDGRRRLEALFDAETDTRVFDGVMENRAVTCGVEAHVREDVRDFEEVER